MAEISGIAPTKLPDHGSVEAFGRGRPCAEPGHRQTLYWFVSPRGEQQTDGNRLPELGKRQGPKVRSTERP